MKAHKRKLDLSSTELLDGIPEFMLTKARQVLGQPSDLSLLKGFVLQNSDQSSEWWETLPPEKNHSVQSVSQV